MKLIDAFKNEQGAIDLGSIMTGVIVLGVIGGVIASTVFAIIPWVQNTAAKESLQSVTTAQGAYRVTADKFGTMRDLIDSKLIEHDSTAQAPNEAITTDGKLCTRTDPDGGYIASSKSATGIYYNITDKSSKPVQVKEWKTCFAEDYTPYTMVFTIDTTQPNCDTYLFPARQLSNVRIIWGDSQDAVPVTEDSPTHTYTERNTYTVKVSGQFQEYGNYEMTNSNCITTVQKWEGSDTKRLTYAFRGATNLTDVEEIPSSATYIANMFMNSNFNGDISHWDTSNVTNMQYMFQSNPNFNQDISNWDMSNVTTIAGMFQSAYAFNQPIGKWNLSSVETVAYTFNAAYDFNQDLSNWNTSNVTSMNSVFNSAAAFNQDISGWDTSKVTLMSNAFSGAKNFKQDLSKWSLAGSPTSDGFRTGSAMTAAQSPFKI